MVATPIPPSLFARTCHRIELFPGSSVLDYSLVFSGFAGANAANVAKDVNVKVEEKAANDAEVVL